MKNEQENNHAEEWVAPSIDVIDINKDTNLTNAGTSTDFSFPEYS